MIGLVDTSGMSKQAEKGGDANPCSMSDLFYFIPIVGRSGLMLNVECALNDVRK